MTRRSSRRFLYLAGGLLVALIILGGVGYIYLNQILQTVVAFQLGSFDEAPTSPQPDYSLAETWAALPDRVDGADVVPTADPVDNQAEAEVDVFFIHPTTYYNPPIEWNAQLDDQTINELTDGIMRDQASVFNTVGRIYAPRYRQASTFAIMGGDEQDILGSFELAYQDIRNAFEYYLTNYNDGRPIIIASHSQGSAHAVRLLSEYFSNSPLREELVAAYLIGYPIPDDVFVRTIPDIPLCELPDETGCLVTWNTVGPQADTAPFESSLTYFPDGYEASTGKPLSCINPLIWTTEGTHAGSELNQGGVLYSEEETTAEPDVGVVDAQCVGNWLQITPPAAEGYNEIMLGRDIYHVYDYSLFYMNIRQNVQDRVTAYLQEHGSA